MVKVNKSEPWGFFGVNVFAWDKIEAIRCRAQKFNDSVASN